MTHHTKTDKTAAPPDVKGHNGPVEPSGPLDDPSPQPALERTPAASTARRERPPQARPPHTARSAREKIANLLWWSVPSSTDEEAKARTEQLLDAYRSEVLAKAIGRLRAIPVTCTALTGPVWYGDGWNSAITVLEGIADYQEPDDEAYPGELQRLRALALATRAALRKGELPEVQRVMDDHVAWEKKATTVGPAPDTLPAWLHWRFGPHGQGWEALSDDDRSQWKHQARAVRRAVARNGFKAQAGEAQ